MRNALTETFKIVSGKYNVSPKLFFQRNEGGTRGHDQKLFKKRFRWKLRKNVFFLIVIDNWNLLPVTCINTSNVTNWSSWRSEVKASGWLQSTVTTLACYVPSLICLPIERP